MNSSALVLCLTLLSHTHTAPRVEEVDAIELNYTNPPNYPFVYLNFYCRAPTPFYEMSICGFACLWQTVNWWIEGEWTVFAIRGVDRKMRLYRTKVERIHPKLENKRELDSKRYQCEIRVIPRLYRYTTWE